MSVRGGRGKSRRVGRLNFAKRRSNVPVVGLRAALARGRADEPGCDRRMGTGEWLFILLSALSCRTGSPRLSYACHAAPASCLLQRSGGAEGAEMKTEAPEPRRAGWWNEASLSRHHPRDDKIMTGKIMILPGHDFVFNPWSLSGGSGPTDGAGRPRIRLDSLAGTIP